MNRREANPAAGGVIVAHPGTQHSYETAIAIQELGLLQSYLTGLYYKPDSRVMRALSTVGPTGRGLLKRYREGLMPNRVELIPLGEIAYLAAVRMGPFASQAMGLVRWRNRRFDRIVARTVERRRPAAIVCYDTCAIRAFTAARNIGALCVLDQSVGHWRTMAQLMKEESELNPDFADSLPLDLPESFLEQCTEEALMADVILAGSDYVKSTMVRYGANPARVAVIPYGADLARFRPAPRVQDSEPDSEPGGKQDFKRNGKFRMLFAGHLSQRKGIKYLLEAVRRLKSPELELTLVGGIVGSGAGLSRYRDYFKHTPNVPHDRIHEHFQQADILVYPSLHEGSAIAIYEALACGLPVITTPNSGSVVRDGIEGFIVPIRDVDALMEAILRLYENRELRAEMARNAYNRGRQFGWNDYRARVGGLLRSMLLDDSTHSSAAAAEADGEQLHVG